MAVTLTFLGAAGSVTGSRFLLEAGPTRILVDCGLCQERDNAYRNWDTFPVPPSSISAVLLTHAHLDHSGWLPRLVAQGFSGRILCTEPTIDITRLLLMDSARIMQEDVEVKKRRHVREGRRGAYPEVPLYTPADAERASALFTPVRYGGQVKVDGHITAEFRDAGHILGSATIRVTARDGGRDVSILFSGDIGRPARPILHDPDTQRGADYVLIETTYGDRSHPNHDIAAELERVINETAAAGGNVVIPAFAVERAQELLYHLGRLGLAGRIPAIPVVLDSPMAQSVTRVFGKYPDLLDADMAHEIREGRAPFDFPGLRFVRSPKESEGVARIPGPTVIIAGSGMATGGRIKQHLINNIGRPESTILFVGYQANGTLGRQILNGQNPVRIYGVMHPVRARIERIDGFSAHVDREGLLEWLAALQPQPKQVFLVHGEGSGAAAFADLLRQRHGQVDVQRTSEHGGPVNGWKVTIPAYGESVQL